MTREEVPECHWPRSATHLHRLDENSKKVCVLPEPTRSQVVEYLADRDTDAERLAILAEARVRAASYWNDFQGADLDETLSAGPEWGPQTREGST